MNDEKLNTASADSLSAHTESESDKPVPEKTTKSISGRKKTSLAAGIIVILFAIIGFVYCIVFAIGKIGDYTAQKKQEQLNEYASLLISAAAIDIVPFDDITGADMSELVEMSVWSIIGSAENPSSFEYKSGSLVVPAAAVEKAFSDFFGTQRTIEHMTVQGYGYEFTYNSTENAYYIPITSLTPIYTPKVTDVEKKGNSITVTVGLVNSDRWLQNSETGDLSSPEPDKYEKVVFREENGNRYISAVRSLSAPETATTASSASVTVTTTPPSESESDASQSTAPTADTDTSAATEVATKAK